MKDKHRLVMGEECSLFNSGYAYHEGYNFYHCSCGNWKTSAKPNEVSPLFLAHVIQQKEDKS